MKSTGKIYMLSAAALAIGAMLGSCEADYYKEEVYRKEIFIVSAEDNIFAQEFNFGGDTGYFSIYAGGSTAIEEDVTVVLGPDYEAIGEYNKRNFDQDYGSYVQELPAANYSIENTSVTLRAGSEMPYALCPVEVHVDDLNVDQDYFIPVRIESVSGYMASKTKDYALMQVFMKNEYATTKSKTFYSMNGTTTKGEFVRGEFVATAKPQVINTSKLLVPIGKRNVRILPAARSTTSSYENRNWSIVVTVDPIQTIDIPVLDSDGLPTDVYYTVRRASLSAYQQSNDAVQVREMDPMESPCYYYPEAKAFVLNYYYKLPQDNEWSAVSEVMYDTRY